MSAPAIHVAIASGDPVELAQALIERLAPAVDDPATHPRDLNILCLRILELVREVHGGRVERSVVRPRLVPPVDCL